MKTGSWEEKALVMGLSAGLVLTAFTMFGSLFDSVAEKNMVLAGGQDLIYLILLIGLPLVDSWPYEDGRRPATFIVEVVVAFLSNIAVLIFFAVVKDLMNMII